MGKISTATTMIVGGLAGAGVMLLFAPTTGKKMRTRMMHRGLELRSDAMDRAEELQGSAQKIFKAQNKRLSKEANRRIKEAQSMAQELTDMAQKRANMTGGTWSKQARRQMDTAQKRAMFTTAILSKQAKRQLDMARDMASELQDRGMSMTGKQKKGLSGLFGRKNKMLRF